jgi:hypothetical protein
MWSDDADPTSDPSLTHLHYPYAFLTKSSITMPASAYMQSRIASISRSLPVSPFGRSSRHRRMLIRLSLPPLSGSENESDFCKRSESFPLYCRHKLECIRGIVGNCAYVIQCTIGDSLHFNVREARLPLLRIRIDWDPWYRRNIWGLRWWTYGMRWSRAAQAALCGGGCWVRRC